MRILNFEKKEIIVMDKISEGYEFNDRVIPPKKVSPIKMKIIAKYKAQPVFDKDEWADFFDIN